MVLRQQGLFSQNTYMVSIVCGQIKLIQYHLQILHFLWNVSYLLATLILMAVGSCHIFQIAIV